MDMTRFGKVLVFVNLAFSMALAAWAFGVYSGRINWVSAGPDRTSSEIEVRKKRLNDLTASLGAAQARWNEASGWLAFTEKRRRDLLAWYQTELQALDSGPRQVSTLVYNNGQLQIDPRTGRPLLQPFRDSAGQALQWRRFYQDELATTQRLIAAEIDRLNKLIAEEKSLTEQIDGPRGLRFQIGREEDNLSRIREEIKALQPSELNTRVQVQMLVDRQKELRDRIAELQRTLGVAAGGR